MVKSIKFVNEKEFQQKIEDQDFLLAQAIVESIIENINISKINVHLLEIECEEEGIIYDYSLDKNKFALTLKENLFHYLKNEKYEKCTKIENIIKQLENEQK